MRFVKFFQSVFGVSSKADDSVDKEGWLSTDVFRSIFSVLAMVFLTSFIAVGCQDSEESDGSDLSNYQPTISCNQNPGDWYNQETQQCEAAETAPQTSDDCSYAEQFNEQTQQCETLESWVPFVASEEECRARNQEYDGIKCIPKRSSYITMNGLNICNDQNMEYDNSKGYCVANEEDGIHKPADWNQTPPGGQQQQGGDTSSWFPDHQQQSYCTPRDIEWCTGVGSWDPNCAVKCPNL